MTELKPCPFCGSKQAFIVKNSLDESGFFYIECDNCHASSARIKEKEENINVWNNRQPSIDWRPIEELAEQNIYDYDRLILYIEHIDDFVLAEINTTDNVFPITLENMCIDVNDARSGYTHFAELTPPKS